MWQRNSETWWRRTIATLLDVSFGTYMRRCRVVLMGRRGNVSLRRLGHTPLRRCWVLYLRLVWHAVETYWWDVAITSSWDVVTTFHQNDVECFIQDVPTTSLGRTGGHSYDVAMTSCCRVGLYITMFVYMFWYIFITLFFAVLPKVTKRLHFWVAWCKFCWFIPEIWCKQRLMSLAQCQES